MIGYLLIPLFYAVTIAGLPLDDHIISKLDQIRSHYIQDANGRPFLADLWVKASNLLKSAEYNASTDNIYYLYTADNPTESQLIVLNDEDGLAETNYNASKRTIVLIHGWNNDATSDFNTVLRQAFLGAEDVNVIVVDWSAGAKTINYASAVSNTGSSGKDIAEVLNWLVNTTGGGSFDNFHLVGHSIGAHAAGVAGRNLKSSVAYITALEPALLGFIGNENCLSSTDGNYTEVIHTNAGIAGYWDTLGDVDFYPNGGTFMPGCILATCDHSRSYYYEAESVSSGGFTAVACDSRADAFFNCDSEETLNMGGLKPKPGRTGIFYLKTNANSPFSQG